MRRVVVLGTALLLIGAGALLWYGGGTDPNRDDPNAAPIPERQGMSLPELQEELQAQTDASTVRLMIDTRPRVTDGAAALLLENPVENSMDLQVIITLDEDGEAVYESPALAPGAQILQGELTKELAPGEYPATATFTALDPDTGGAVGSPGGVSLVLTVEETPGMQQP